MFKREYQLTKRYYVHANTISNTSANFVATSISATKLLKLLLQLQLLVRQRV